MHGSFFHSESKRKISTKSNKIINVSIFATIGMAESRLVMSVIPPKLAPQMSSPSRACGRLNPTRQDMTYLNTAAGRKAEPLPVKEYHVDTPVDQYDLVSDMHCTHFLRNQCLRREFRELTILLHFHLRTSAFL